MSRREEEVDQARRRLLRLLTNDGDVPAHLPMAADFAGTTEEHAEQLLTELGFHISYAPPSLRTVDPE